MCCVILSCWQESAYSCWEVSNDWGMCKRGQQIPFVAQAQAPQPSPQNICTHPWAKGHCSCRPAPPQTLMCVLVQTHAGAYWPEFLCLRSACMRNWRISSWSLGHLGFPPCFWTTGTETWGSPPPPRSSVQPTSQKARTWEHCILAPQVLLWWHRPCDESQYSHSSCNTHFLQDAAGLESKIPHSISVNQPVARPCKNRSFGPARKCHQYTKSFLSLALRFRTDAVSGVSSYSLEHAFAAGQFWSEHIFTFMPKGQSDPQPISVFSIHSGLRWTKFAF